MKKIISALVVVICLTACGEIQVRTEETILAPRSEVWQVLVNFNKYPDWNPYHVMVKGEPKLGADLVINIHRPDGKSVEIPPHIIRLEEGRELTWGGGIKGVFFGEHVLLLEDVPGGTRLSHNEDFTGMFVGFADLPPEVLTEGYKSMNKALKEYVEEKRNNPPKADG
ncbi:MAG: SRPBCC domain-containing protein [Oceanicoccus sp.]